MGRYILRRLIYMVIVIVVVSFITFGLMHAVPGGPFDKEKKLPAEIIANLEKRYKLDQPLWKQYVSYLNDVFIPHFSKEGPKGLEVQDDTLINIKISENLWIRWMNFGPTFTSRSRSVNDIFRQQLPISFQLGLMALTDRNCNWRTIGDYFCSQAKHTLGLLWDEHCHIWCFCPGYCHGSAHDLDFWGNA